ncbi:MAG TPA: hypothetical protein P5295_17170 [Spirochaetota bacterium]|nr:hypothetical protein [Spirochaetota bacterium]
MGDVWDGNTGDTFESEKDLYRKIILQESRFIDFEFLLKSENLDVVAEIILEGTYGEMDFMKKDIIDRFLDFIYFKTQTGFADIPHMVYPIKRMMDSELEKKITVLINEYLYPEIVLHLLKFFSRNIHNPDSNLCIANFITSDEIIRSVFETYRLFKKDVFIADPDRRALNVKRIQQFSPRSDNKLSSPLDQAAIYKYILEYLAIKNRVGHIYTPEDLLLSVPED